MATNLNSLFVFIKIKAHKMYFKTIFLYEIQHGFKQMLAFKLFGATKQTTNWYLLRTW